MTETPAPFLVLDVSGLPVPQGSMKTWMHKGKPIVTSASKGLKEWRNLVALQASLSMQGRAPIPKRTHAVEITLAFHMPRPGSGVPKSQKAPRSRPDLDKLVRAVFDALTGVAFQDDSQATQLRASKTYADGRAPGVVVTLWAVEDGIRRPRKTALKQLEVKA
jgi:crossover junction endodeoxyribonuclease RusA